MRRMLTVASLVLLIPALASAITVDDLKVQLQNLLSRVSELRTQLEKTIAKPFSSEPQCLQLSRDLSFGNKGEDVRQLQEFLVTAGALPNGNATGYFGKATEAAVKKWQTEKKLVSSGDLGSTGFGGVGQKTRAAIRASCVKKNTPSDARSCPKAPAVPSLGCEGTWEKGFDAAGCHTGYQCIVPRLAEAQKGNASIAIASTSITLVEPGEGAGISGGNSLRIAWKSVNPPVRAIVSLTLINEKGEDLGELGQSANPSGVFYWQVPVGGEDCAPGESAFNCILKFGRCEGSASICNVPPGLYRIRATLSNTVRATSAPFRISGSDISGIVSDFVSAPVPSAATSPSANDSPDMCRHEGVSYADGTTLSVSCDAGRCTNETSGYITGVCTKGKWCIPLTTYCAATFAEIDVGSYAGTNAAPIGSGHAINCGTSGLRAYMTCEIGSCKSGYHICQGGSWVYDPDQSIR